MKGKIDNKFDFDDSTFSPPSHDDSFFYIRYPKRNQSQQSTSQGFRPIDEVLSENNITTSTSQVKAEQHVSDAREGREVDFSKHPLPCQPYIQTTTSRANDVKPPKITLAGSSKVKSQGTDDGFHGEPALCGKSIVHVANQIMTTQFSKMLTTEQNEGQLKKGSKSLPATPLTSPIATPDSSPKARRRTPSNRYFTGSFVPDREKYQGGWILASILKQSREIAAAKIDEEDESPLDVAPSAKLLSRKKSISSQNLTYLGSGEKSTDKSEVYPNVLQAKPSELREMNFWSPTSF